MAYTKYIWRTGDSITEAQMNNIEDGVDEALGKARDAVQKNSTQDETIETMQGNISSINSRIGGNYTASNTVNQHIESVNSTLSSQITANEQASKQGQRAWNQLLGVGVEYDTNAELFTTTLANVLSKYTLNTIIQAAYQTPNAADTIPGLDGQNVRVASLAQRIQHIYNSINSTNNALNQTNQNLSDVSNRTNYVYDSIGGQSGLSVAARLGALDGGNGTLPTRTVQSLIAEISDAHSSTALSSNGSLVPFTDLDSRFENIETELVGAHITDGPQTLDARFDNIDGGGVPTRTLPSVISEIAAAHRQGLVNDQNESITDTLDNRFDDIDTRIDAIDNSQNNSSLISRVNTLENTYVNKNTMVENGLTYTQSGKVLDARQGKALNDKIIELDNALDTRLDALEAARPSTTDDQTGEVTYGTLDDRFDAIEDDTAQLRTDVNTIASELSMYNTQTHAISDTNSRVDVIEENVVAMAKEIGMLQDSDAVIDLSTAVSRTNTRVDDITGELDDARIQIGTDAESGEPIMSTLDQRLDRMDTVTNNIINAIDQVADDSDPEHPIPAGLTQRLTAAEGNIDNLENAISHTKDPLDANDKGGLEQRMDAVENVASNAATSSALAALAGRVTTLEREPKSATVVMDNVTYNSITGEPSNINDPSTDVDYLLKKEDKYYYWKYIKTSSNPDTYAWALISGGGGSGTGNSSGVVLTEQEYNDVELVKEENTDYFVQKTDGYHHYRWIPTETEGVLEQIEIGDWASINKDKIKRYNIYKTSEGTGADEKVYLNLYQYDYDAESTAIDTENLDNYFARVELPKGGTGTSSTTVNQLIRLGNQTIETIVGSTVKLRVFFSSYDGPQKNDGDYVLKAGSTTIETGKIYSCDDKDEVVSGWKANTAGYQEFDVTGYCRAGNTNFTLTVTVNEMSLGKNWTVDMKDLRIESDAPDTLLIPSDESYIFPYTPFGALEKYLHVVIDGDTTHETTVRLVSSTSGRPNNITITPEMITATGNAIHSAHTVRLYLTATIGGIQQTTDSINREYIWYDATDTETPVIMASPYNGQTLAINQYSTIAIPYQVYKKNATSIDVYYYLDEELEPFDHVELEETNVGTLAYLASITGPHTLTIKVDNQSVVVNLTVTAIEGVDISPITGAVIDFDPTSLTNSSINRLPSWTAGGTTYSLTASNNFNWSDDVSGGGYKQDEDGRCFVIKAGSYVDLNYKMFENNVFDTGAEIKVIFKTKAVRNADAVWFSNTGSYNDKTVGIQLGAHVGWLKTDKAVDTDQENIASQYASWVSGNTYNVDDLVVYKEIIYKCIQAVVDNPETADVNETTINPKDASDNWLAMGKIDTEVLSTNSYLYLPYSEKDKIELDININKYTQGATNNFIMSYEDGVPSKAYAYTYGLSGDGLIHNNGIRIGSTDCDVYIYHLRIYNKALTTAQILQNFIADGSDIDAKISRYNRNCIYWDSTQDDGQGRYFTSPSGTAVLDPIKLAEKIPNVKILMLDTPTFTVGKKNFIPNSTLRCVHARGGDLYPSRGDADNWFFDKGLHAGQGTTSDNYGQSSRNVDFLFICDKVHWPTKEKNVKKTFDITKPENKDYQSSVIVGENATKWDEGTETWVPTTIWDDTNEEWVANTDILSAAELQTWTATPPDYCLDWKGDNCKVALTSTSIPNNYFNLKVNVASSENVNNALFQERYNEFLSSIYQSPAYKRDHKIKNDMEFVPAILFVRENDTTKDAKGNYSKHNEFNDTKWHFYALGNIGDSKKTDYTRAYNPKDMNEFTVENSDNNTNNGQFQSGVFESNDVRYLETDFSAWSDTVAYKQNDIVIVNNKIYKRSAADMAALGENETATWVAADWTDVTPVTTETINYAPRTNPNPMDYIFPISSEEWNVQLDGEYLNRKHATLVNEEFDGDHSFEFRYACMGDYRDGDLINDTTGLAKSQFNINHQLVLDFYEWLVTAPEETFKTEAAHWIVPEAMEFFYAYTHYYTMMDNRAKNTFWHWGKNYITSNDANGTNYNTARLAAEAAQTAYDEAADDAEAAETEQRPIITQAEADIAAANETLQEDPTDAEALAAKAQAEQDKADAEAIIAAAETAKKNAKSQLNARIIKRDELKFLYDHADCFIIDNAEAAINEGRRFDLWAYDMDTAAGIDNNGALVFPYGKEDEDYRVDGEESSGYAFNGAGSIFWRRLKKTFADDIVSVMNNVDVSCFDSENLIDQFDNFQSCFPEEIWRLDIERKYIRTFTGAAIDNSVTTGKQNPRFLTSMMQGRKKYQRRQWIRDQGVYFNSKYRLTDITRNENTIEFNIITPTNASSLALAPNYDLKLTPYQDMYLNVQVGNGNYQPQIRAKAGQTYTIDLAKYTSGTFQETRIYINGFNSISGIGNLAPMYPYSFTLSALEHLKVLDLGTDTVGYNNANFTSLPFEEATQLPLLETLNIKNCNALSGSIKLNTANNLRTVEATGTAISGIILPDYSNIETLHLPASVSAISLYGARFLKDFTMLNAVGQTDYSGLYTLHIYDSDYSANFKVNPSDPIPVDWISIANSMINKQNLRMNIQLLKLSSATVGDISALEPLVNIKDDIEAARGQVELSGLIHVTGNWSTVERDNYGGLTTSVWPDLTFDVTSGTEKVKCKVIYMNSGYQGNDGWVPASEIEIRYINTDGNGQDTVIPDIYRGTAVANLPTRPSTIAEVYQFGMIDQDSYMAYSGWALSQNSDALSLYDQGYNVNNLYHAIPSVTELTLYTHFTAAPHEYAVKWYLDDDTVVKTVTGQQYGGGYTLEAPTVKELRANGYTNKLTKVTLNQDGTVTYKIFDGWQKLPTNIDPKIDEANVNTYRINAKWHEDTKPLSGTGGLFEDTSSILLEQLLVRSRMNSTNRTAYPDSNNIVATMKFNYQMGFDGTIAGTSIVNSGNIKRITSNSATTGEIINDIYPFSTSNNNNGFTLVIDYKFDDTQTTDADATVLVGCYDKNNGTITGFSLYNNFNTNRGETGIRVGYGDMFNGDTTKSTLVGHTNTRNIVVLRHPKGSSQLWIYSSISAYGSTTDSAITIATIDVTTQTFSNNAVICLGNLRNDLATNNNYSDEYNNLVGAYGTIYWMKYWNEDLGAGECKQLAAWPHEQMTAIIAAVDNAATNDLLTRPSIYLTNLTASSHGFVLPNRFAGNSITEGWGTSTAKTICDNRIFSGLPTRLQSVLSNPSIGYRNYVATTTQDYYGNQTTTVGLGNIQSTTGIVYVPSISSLEDNMTDYFGESRLERTGSAQNTNSDITPYAWIGDSSAMEVRDYNVNVEGNWVLVSSNADYLNLRFYNRPLTWSSTNPIRIFRISQATFTNKSLYSAIMTTGAVQTNDIVIVENDAAYIYIPSSEFTTYGAFTEPQGNVNSLFNTLYNGSTRGGWMKSTAYITRSVSASSQNNSNFIYINTRGETIIPAESSTQPGLLSLDYAFTI